MSDVTDNKANLYNFDVKKNFDVNKIKRASLNKNKAYLFTLTENVLTQNKACSPLFFKPLY